MVDVSPTILALDFDGVICDGLQEYFQSTCGAYTRIWGDGEKLDRFADSFYTLRPVIETGWEMPILLRALVLGVTEGEILNDWGQVLRSVVAQEGLEKEAIAPIVDRVRDEWIDRDLDSWLSLHRFYPGIIERLQPLLLTDSPQVWIISTKEGRFIQQLLQQGGLEFPPERIIGKEVKRPKGDTLQQLLTPSSRLWFVEDRLQTLLAIQTQETLQNVTLFLADWGYNTERDRAAISTSNLHLLSLSQFALPFPDWLA